MDCLGDEWMKRKRLWRVFNQTWKIDLTKRMEKKTGKIRRRLYKKIKDEGKAQCAQ